MGQRGDTVYYQVTTNAVANGGATLPSSQSIGQPYHILLANFSDRPGRTCTNVSSNFNVPAIDIFGGGTPALAAVQPITNYVRVIRPATTQAESRYRMIASASGAYPYITFGYRDWNTTDCQLSLLYSGSLSTLDIKKYADVGSIYDSLQFQIINVNTAGNNTIVSVGCPDCRITVYGLVLFNQTTQTISVQDIRSDAGVVDLMRFTNWCTGCQVALPNTNFPLFTTSTGGLLNLSLSASTAVSGYILYRVE